MPDKKVKIANILGSLIPDFIQADNPLFKEFLSQYYESEEREYGTTYLAENLASFKDIQTVSEISLVENQTITPPNSSTPLSPVILSSFLYAYDDVIYVNQTTGFPDKYGLLKIDDEIITYTEKTKNTFVGCVRGFSGISEIETQGDPEFLTFSDTNATTHDANSVIVNLSFLFINQFYKKFKYQFLPGLEGRSLQYGIGVENILSRARDFYSSKGTDASLKILFQVLFGDQVEIVKPFNETIIASEAEWDVTDDIVVEAIFGDPTNLVGTQIYQDSFDSPTASGAVANVQTKFLKNKKYYKISFSKGTINNKFKVPAKTKIVGTASTTEVTTVDSTIGFSTTSGFYYLNADNEYTLASFTSKSNNQFFGCTGITTVFKESDTIIGDTFVYGYENNDLEKFVEMRVTGSISGTAENVNVTKYFDSGDIIRVKHLGEKPELTDQRYNKWFYNNLSYVDVIDHDNTNTFTTRVNHFLNVGDLVDVIVKDTNNIILTDIQVNDVIDSSQVKLNINPQTGLPLLKFRNYVLKKKLNYVNSNFGQTSLLSNIQNSYTDKEKNTYVSFSGYPSFNSQTTNRSHSFNSSDVSENNFTITISNHNFINGERVYLNLSDNSGITGSLSGYFYVKVVDINTIKLSTNPANLYQEVFERIKFSGTAQQGNETNTITPANLYDGGQLKNQNNFKRIYKNPKPPTAKKNISGAVGVSLNGIEYHSPISDDSIFYGQLEKIDVLNPGQGYDVINPPSVSIADTTGSGSEVHGNFSGTISEVLLNEPGFDYVDTPAVTITGGNGSGAVCEAKMRAFSYNAVFGETDVIVSENKIRSEHRFLDGEEVIYTANGTPIGITTGVNVGFATDLLSSGTSYFIARYTDDSFALAITRDRAINKTNLLQLRDDGSVSHQFTSTKVRRIIDRIEVNEIGTEYKNKKVLISSQQYPPTDRKDLFKTFVGINTFDNYVYARNHNFSNGDVIEYSTSSSVISGLDTNAVYKVTVIDSNKFKLSNAGTSTTISNTNYDRKIYVNLDSVGVGTHTFKYPDIAVKISGIVSLASTSIVPNYYNASAEAIVKGKLESVFIRNGGVGFGVTDIINYTRKPTIKLLTGKKAFLSPIVSNGKIVNVLIRNGGEEYTTPPELQVFETENAKGTFARIKSIISNGEITGFEIINAGVNYSSKNTRIRVVPTGKDAKFTSSIHEWKINDVKRYDYTLTEDNSQIIQVKADSRTKGNKICSFYPPKKYRRLLRDNIGEAPNYTEDVSDLSKIVGWAYDGNPIFGPVGPKNVGVGFTFLQSSYQIDLLNDPNLRPPTIQYPSGYFIDDYIYNDNNELDEYNGRYLKSSELPLDQQSYFPNGTYAYFSSIDKVSKEPSFPYITFAHRNETDTFNYDRGIDQSDNIVNTGDYKRNVTHLGLNEEFRNYPLLSDPLNSQTKIKVSDLKSSNITDVTINDAGSSYKVGDKLNFNDLTVNAEIKEVSGKEIVSVATTNTVIENIEFSVLDGVVTGVATIPHNLTSNDIVEIAGISSTAYKNIEGFRVIGLSTVTVSTASTILNSNTTGITTFISLSGSTLDRVLKINDVIQIESEQLVVIDFDDVNNKHRVIRAHNGTTGSEHDAGVVVTRLETEFTFPIKERVENKNIETSKVRYFESEKAVGIGSTYTNVIVGRVGNNPGIGTIFKSIPPRAIYLPNHKFKTGDELSFVALGSTIFASSNDSLSPQFDLSTIDKFYCVKFNDEFIGLSTQKANFTTNYIYYQRVETSGGDNNKLEIIKENISGSLTKVNGLVTVAAATTIGQQHGLSLNEEFNLDIKSNRTQTFDLRYNENLRKLVVNPVSFASTSVGIGTTISTITLHDHDFSTGELVVYNSSTPATPLVNDGIYYVIKDSNKTIRLAENEYDLSVFPYNYIGIGSTGGGSHQISRINPKLEFYRDNRIEILTSDTSLTDYDLQFYTDSDFISRYDTDLISKSGTNGDGDSETKVIISVGSSLASKFYYRLEGISSNFTKTLPSAADDRVPNHSEIQLVDSKFNTRHRVTGIGETTFTFNPIGVAETTSLSTAGISSAFYFTNSSGEDGGIHSIKILGKGFEATKLPILTSIGTTSGVNAVLTIETDEIGTVVDTQSITQGLEFPSDHTLKPKADSNTILELKNPFTLKSIGVTTGGRNYTSPPSVIAIGNDNIVTRVSLNGTSVNKVEILTNDTGLSEDLRIIPTVNSNGVLVTRAETNNEIVTLFLKAPITEREVNESGFFDNGGTFPFAPGDKIFVENIKTLGDGDGYNSSDYNYQYFTILPEVGVGINTANGGELIRYSIAGLSTNGGTYQSENNFGRVIKVSDLAGFTPTFEKVSFFENENIIVPSSTISGFVAKNGWDSESQTLKIFDIQGNFKKDDIIIGSVSNNKATISNIFEFDFDLNVDSSAENINDWKTDTGKLNLDTQRVHDNDYYQRFSYAVKGTTPYLTWKDSVDSLNHVAGFKNFSNLEIASSGKIGLTSDSQVDLEVDIEQEASVHEKFYYDTGIEDTDDPALSKLIKFDTKTITDYNESRTNKVLLIDDISTQFTGIVTSVGGGVIGTTSFNIFNAGDSLLHKEFNPSSGINTSNDQVTIPRHEFNTAEHLKYAPGVGQTAIGIENTTVPGVGVTNILPSDVYAIKVTNDVIKVAVAASFATAGTAVTFTTISGIGTNHTLSVPADDATIRSIITIDNIIQSPVAISTAISVNMVSGISISTDRAYLNDVSDIQGKSLLRISNEIVKVNLVGVGSASELQIDRGQMGTVAAAHTAGATVTVLKGDYRINEGRLYFTAAPYGRSGSLGITTSSQFSGRLFYRLNYQHNKIIDDISDRFDGATDKFDLTTNNVEVSGINTSFGAFLINNIFQRPFYGSPGSILESDYQIVGTGKTIDFTGITANKDLPRGGIINEFDVGIGSGYQIPRKAIFSAVVSAAGTVQSIGIVTGGSGYITPPLVSIGSTTGSGASAVATITNGSVSAVSVTNPGSGYTSTGISTGLNFATALPPSPYKNIPLVGGNGTGASMDVVVGTGGSVISFEIANRGLGYEINDRLEITSLPFQVGIGTTNFHLTVKNKYQDKFAGWTFGQLLELDDFSAQFNGVRKSFLMTRTIGTRDYYSVVAQDGSGIVLANNLLIFINDVLQKPDLDYKFSGGTRIVFTEAPKSGSKFKLYLYTGSTDDFTEVDVDETVKPGDELRLQFGYNDVTSQTVSAQENRVIYDLISSDTVETQTYSGVGIVTNSFDFTRPIMWRRQTKDLIIDGAPISKERNYLEPKIEPTSGIIKSITPSDTKIYIKDSYLFDKVDNLPQTENKIRIVGLGTTAVVETIEGVTYNGDYGIVVGVGTSATGINTTTPALYFDLRLNRDIYNTGDPAITNPGIGTGDYFVIKNTVIGNGITGIKTSSSGPETVSVGTSFLDNVYYAANIVSVGATTVRVFANVNSISGINTSSLSNMFKVGDYSWGSIECSRTSSAKSFTFHNQNGLTGIETSAQVMRVSPVLIKY